MNIITKEAEMALRQMLQDYFFHSPYKRVIFIRLSQTNIEQENWQNIVIQATQEFFLDDVTDIFFCDDRDIFIVNRMCTLKRLDQFMTHLTSKLSPASLSGLASLFEVCVDMDRIRALCSKKIEALTIQRISNNKSEVKKAPIVNPSAHIDEQLLNTIKLRRKDRKQAEIMIVEDDPFSQKLINRAIGDQYSLTMTGDGQGAIMNYIKKAPDVLFLDIGLPDIDGHEVLKQIFKIDPDAFVVMFSGKGDRENVTRAVQTGAKGFIGKPFTQEKLFQYINKSPFIIEKKQGAHI